MRAECHEIVMQNFMTCRSHENFTEILFHWNFRWKCHGISVKYQIGYSTNTETKFPWNFQASRMSWSCASLINEGAGEEQRGECTAVTAAGPWPASGIGARPSTTFDRLSSHVRLRPQRARADRLTRRRHPPTRSVIHILHAVQE